MLLRPSLRARDDHVRARACGRRALQRGARASGGRATRHGAGKLRNLHDHRRRGSPGGGTQAHRRRGRQARSRVRARCPMATTAIALSAPTSQSCFRPRPSSTRCSMDERMSRARTAALEPVSAAGAPLRPLLELDNISLVYNTKTGPTRRPRGPAFWCRRGRVRFGLGPLRLRQVDASEDSLGSRAAYRGRGAARGSTTIVPTKRRRGGGLPEAEPHAVAHRTEQRAASAPRRCTWTRGAHASERVRSYEWWGSSDSRVTIPASFRAGCSSAWHSFAVSCMTPRYSSWTSPSRRSTR